MSTVRLLNLSTKFSNRTTPYGHSSIDDKPTAFGRIAIDIDDNWRSNSGACGPDIIFKIISNYVGTCPVGYSSTAPGGI
eukprot:SAG31_NODE_3707_length_3970_cov_8.036941_3_plen_79_part_00